MKKKFFICVLIFSLLLPNITTAKNDTRYYESSCKWETYFDNPDLFENLSGLPYGTIPVANGRPFNYRIWYGKGIVVYGTPEQANSDDTHRKNYKEGTLSDNGIGFYKKAGYKRGEYRYDGYTREGNLYANVNFPLDVERKTKLEDIAWIYRYWESDYVNKAFKGEPSAKISVYTKAAIVNISDTDKKTREWINNGIADFKIRNGVKDTGLKNPAPDRKEDGTWDFHNFLNVQSAPSAKFNGEGRMFRFDKTGHLFYMIFTIKKYQKEHTPVDVSVNVQNESDLEFIDYGDDNPAGFEKQTIDVKVEVTARLKDEEHMKDQLARAVYYTREDRERWEITLNGEQAREDDIQIYDNCAKTVFTIPMTKGQIKALKGNGINFRATARCIYFDERYDEGSSSGNAVFSIKEQIIKTEEKVPFLMEPKCVIPQKGFDIVKFDAHDNTDMSGIKDRKVLINGIEVDDEQFFSGNYIFGIGQDGLKKIDVYYTDNEGKTAFHTAWAYIYDTKPTAQFRISGTYKQNRKLTVTDISNIGGNDIVNSTYPISSYTWKFRAVSGSEGSIRKKDISTTQKDLLFKTPGSYEVELVVKNSLGRVSDPYIVRFEIFPDYEPALEIDLDNSVISRLETVTAWNYNACSTDNDIVSKNTIELWYDSDNDGRYDKLLETYDGSEGFPEFHPVGLGRYKFVNTVEESFGEDTIPEFITDEDRVSRTVEREILVDNIQPMAGLYVQIPMNRTQTDTFIMMDSSLDSEKVKYIKDNRIEFNNYLRSCNIRSNVETWDLHTYEYTQSVSTTVNTGSSTPPETTEYTSDGYYGVLERIRTSNNKYQTDEGSYVTEEEKKTVTGTLKGWAIANYVYTAGGWRIVSSDASDQPSMSYDKDGFTGTLEKVSYTTDSDNGVPTGAGKIGDTYTRKRTYTGYYSGEVTKTVEVWEPDMVWHDDYTGFYEGTIRKEVKQPYTDPFRPTSDKYIIYITDDKINDMNDLSTVLNRSGAKLILVGPVSISSQMGYENFIENNRDISELMQEALDIIGDTGEAEKYTILAGEETLKLSVADYDEENDAISEKKMLYVHDADFYDNGSGLASFAVKEYSEDEGWVDMLADKLVKPGKYTIYRRVKDDPSSDPAFDSFSRYSGTPFIEIYAHRRPVANATLDWDYDREAMVYRTTWVDNSYDPDHQYSRADKGIIERKIMYRATGGEWIYTIPDKLSPGTYELRYYVKDPENTWSEPMTMDFTLEEAPPIQFNASLRALDSRFDLAGIPASEKLEAYDLWTRYPGDVKLEMAFYKGTSRVSTLKSVKFGDGKGIRTGNDITWNNIVYQIPDTLPDGTYDFRITATGDDGRSTVRSFSVRVSTPIGLVPKMLSEVSGGAASDVRASTSKYADSVNVILLHGTMHAKSYNLTNSGGADGSSKEWKGNLNIPSGIPDGEYVARFVAAAPNGTTQSRDVSFKLVNLAITDVKINGYWNHWRGQTDIFGKQMTVEPHRFLSLECVNIDISTIGDPDKVTVRFSPELESMHYTDPNGHTYHYTEFMDHQVKFPEDSTLSVSGNQAHWEYHLPLAPSSKDWNNNRLRPQYSMTVTAYKGSNTATFVVDDIDITGNIYDLTYIQPKD
jgi:hypothetical protein